MSRTKTIQKLGNAIREFRGLSSGDEWIHTPKPRAEARIIRYLEKLGVDVNEARQKIRTFKTLEEFRTWMRTLDLAPLTNSLTHSPTDCVPARAASSVSSVDSCSLPARALAALPEGEDLPRDIQVFPPGEQVEFTLADFPGEIFRMKVDPAVAAKAQADLEKLFAAELQGRGSAPFADKNHEDAEATFHPVRFYWAGEDPKAGGVRLETRWTPFGAQLVKARAFKYFSGNFLFNKNSKKFLGLINENIGGLVNRPGFASQQAFAKAADLLHQPSTINHQLQMTDKEIQDAITNGITAGLKPVVSRLDTLEASAKGATSAAAQPGADDKIVLLITQAVKPFADKLQTLETDSKAQILASAKATVQTLGVKAGRIPAQDADQIKFWEDTIAANAKAADQLAKIPVNPALLTIVANAAAGGTGTATGAGGEHEFIVKARAHAETHKITDPAEAQTAYARTPEGQKLYRQYAEALAPRK